jgi:hypothetical protein
MRSALRNPAFRHLFAAQVVALVGTGLATVALGLLAWQLAGEEAGAGLSASALTLAAVGATGLVAVLRLWPARDPEVVVHDHSDLPPDHPHLRAHGTAHAHALVIDDLHRRWPKGAA